MCTIQFVMRLFLMISWAFCSLWANAQQEVKTYFDPFKTQLQEHYFLAENGQMEGKYRKFYPNGKLAIEGVFANGVRSGTFYEYHENGVLIRKIN